MISFVILHYKNIDDTVECIKSIYKLDTDKKISIVIVCNSVLSDSDFDLLNSYSIDFVNLNENVGFARGNNAGCEFAIKKYNPDFLCVINNDTVIEQSDFIDKIYKCYDETSFDMMGPRIITDGGDSVNPFPVYKSIHEIDEKIRYSNKLIKIYGNVFLRFLLSLYLNIKHFFKKPSHLINGSKSQYGVALHGCALVFSRKYYEKYKFVFYPGTFLYHEEEFLYFRMKRDGLVSYYNSDLEIFHKEGSSLNLAFKNQNYKKLIFKNKEIVRSLTLLKEVIVSGRED